MILSDLNNRAKPYRKRKRKGRGQASGMGKTCGRGTKGSGARSGYKTYAGFAGGALPVHRRFPKRGFTNVFRKHYDTVNVSASTRCGASTKWTSRCSPPRDSSTGDTAS